MMYKWGLRDTLIQHFVTVMVMSLRRHITYECPIRAFKDITEDIHLVKEEAMGWMKNLDLKI